VLAIRCGAAIAAEHQLAAISQAGLACSHHSNDSIRELHGDPPLQLGGTLHHHGKAGGFVHGNPSRLISKPLLQRLPITGHRDELPCQPAASPRRRLGRQ
jgi:hypothetical protein